MAGVRFGAPGVVTLDSPTGRVRISHGAGGAAVIESTDLTAAYYGLGYAQGRDRLMQIWSSKLLVEGRLSEVLGGRGKLLATDRHYRGLHLKRPVEREALDHDVRSHLEAFCAGLNRGARTASRPLARRLMHPARDPWEVEDSFAVARLMGYSGLADGQIRAELALARILQQDPNSLAGFQRLLYPYMENYDQSWLDGLTWGTEAGVSLGSAAKNGTGKTDVGDNGPRRTDSGANSAGANSAGADSAGGTDVSGDGAGGSNGWVVSGSRTLSGKPLLCNDPHLSVSRLPAVWYETVLKTPEMECAGMLVPGVPAFILGSNGTLAWGITYASTDSVDAWIEECRDEEFLQDGTWHPFRRREEVIANRGQASERVVFYENQHGLLYGDPRIAGRYSAIRWSGGEREADLSLQAAMRLASCQGVEEARRTVAQISVPSLNWMLADTRGNIGHQMSGLIPRRLPGHTGLLPLPGWESRFCWHGFLGSEELPGEVNPRTGFLVTANNRIQTDSEEPMQSLPFPADRADRIAQLLEKQDAVGPEEMRAIQLDLHSVRADRVLGFLQTALFRHTRGRQILDWDRRFHSRSREATLFYQFRALLMEQVCKDRICGRESWRMLVESPLSGMLYRRIEEEWLDPEGLFADVDWDREVETALDHLPAKPRRWGKTRRFRMRHIVLGGSVLGRLLYNRGPYVLDGAPETINAGSIGRSSALGATARLIADLGSGRIQTALAGGRDGNPLSRFYSSGIRSWLTGRLKILVDWGTQRGAKPQEPQDGILT